MQVFLASDGKSGLFLSDELYKGMDGEGAFFVDKEIEQIKLQTDCDPPRQVIFVRDLPMTHSERWQCGRI